MEEFLSKMYASTFDMVTAGVFLLWAIVMTSFHFVLAVPWFLCFTIYTQFSRQRVVNENLRGEIRELRKTPVSSDAD